MSHARRSPGRRRSTHGVASVRRAATRSGGGSGSLVGLTALLGLLLLLAFGSAPADSGTQAAIAAANEGCATQIDPVLALVGESGSGGVAGIRAMWSCKWQHGIDSETEPSEDKHAVPGKAWKWNQGDAASRLAAAGSYAKAGVWKTSDRQSRAPPAGA